MQYLLVVAIACMAALQAQARTYTFNASTVKGDLTEQLRKAGKNATYRDTVVVNFDKGTYTISGSVIFYGHLVMRGQGADKTTVLLDNGKDRPGFKAFNDDCFFDVFGTLANPLSASITDISFRLKDHQGIWFTENDCYAFKIRHCNRVDIHNVASYMYNAKITNFDLHVCSNVNITDCNITNYNNCDIGGCIWIRGEMHNINIKRNIINKYGKDEAVAVYDRVVDHSKKYIRGKANRTDIFVEDNEFHYGYNGKDKNLNAICDMVFSLYTDQLNSDDRCMTRNFHLSGNKFYINEKTTRCIYIAFERSDDHDGIYIENNQIINGKTGRDDRYYRWDIDVHDLSKSSDVIHISGNNVQNNDCVMNDSGTTGYTFLQMRGGHVDLTNNTVVNNVTKAPKNGKQYGVQLIWCQPTGNSTVNMKDNVCKGLDCVAHVGAWETAQQFSLTASNNYFAGNTRVYCHNIQKLDLDFTGNTFNSNTEAFFLQEFAQKGTVTFNNNDVTVTKGNGQFMTHSSSKGSTRSMRFDKLEIKNNVIKGAKSEKDMLKNVTNTKKRKVINNRIH